jgi:hypothetical protein
MPLDTPGEFEFEQNHAHLCDTRLGGADEIIHGDRSRSEKIDDPRTSIWTGISAGSRTAIRLLCDDGHRRLIRLESGGVKGRIASFYVPFVP